MPINREKNPLDDFWDELKNNAEITRILAVMERFNRTGYHVSVSDALPLSKGWICDPDIQDAVPASTADDLKRLTKGIEAANAALKSLHPSILQSLEYSFASTRKEEDGVRFFTRQNEPFNCYDQISTLLTYLQEGLAKENPASPITNALKFAEEIPTKSKQATIHSTWAKIKLVRNARAIWPSLTGNRSAPLEPSPGTNFFEFVAELTCALELSEGWETRSVFNAYGKHTKSKS